jgi:GMP synthase-like glutamine amidotransferase
MAALLNISEEKIYILKMSAGFASKLPKDISEVILAGGTDKKISKDPLLKREIFKFILNCELPLIGICNGAQLIARAHGSGIVQLPKARKGIYDIRIVKDKDLFDNKYQQTVYKTQSWSLQNLPPEFVVYATSGDGVEMYRHKKKRLGGVQFHPELFMGACQGADLFREFRAQISRR